MMVEWGGLFAYITGRIYPERRSRCFHVVFGFVYRYQLHMLESDAAKTRLRIDRKYKYLLRQVNSNQARMCNDLIPLLGVVIDQQLA